MIELSITRTAKAFGNQDDYTIYDEATKYFTDLAEAKEWLKEEFGNSKRQPMYVDNKDGSTRKVGHVYGFKNDYDKCYEQAWIRYFKVTPLAV